VSGACGFRIISLECMKGNTVWRICVLYIYDLINEYLLKFVTFHSRYSHNTDNVYIWISNLY